jgi:hypothetical protein
MYQESRFGVGGMLLKTKKLKITDSAPVSEILRYLHALTCENIFMDMSKNRWQ